MITAAIIGASLFGGPVLTMCALDRQPFWKGTAITAGVALFGAALIAGMVASVTSNPHKECPPNTVMAAETNKLYTGCVPTDIAKRQVENQ